MSAIAARLGWFCFRKYGEHAGTEPEPSGRTRFIPAGAGNTASQTLIKSLMAVYPRWRGEHMAFIAAVILLAGLSPLARGTPYLCCARQGDIRFIPAGAGNTVALVLAAVRLPVYPRWRGEHASLLNAGRLKLGLSPLARGTRIQWFYVAGGKRFIPAGAGNTRYHHHMQTQYPVYPRWRGEHACCSALRPVSRGLSPLARGTLCGLFELQIFDRFIPAGAGNTVRIA